MTNIFQIRNDRAQLDIGILEQIGKKGTHSTMDDGTCTYFIIDATIRVNTNDNAHPAIQRFNGFMDQIAARGYQYLMLIQ